MKDYGLLLKSARESRGMTQEQASAKVGVSVDTWYAYEANIRLPQPETVSRICTVLDAGWLAWYFQEARNGDINVLPAAKARWLPTAVLTLLNRVMAFSEHSRARELMEIAEDGVIDDAERSLYNDIVAELDGIVEAALAVKYPVTDTKKERPEAGTSKRSVQGLRRELSHKNYNTRTAVRARPNLAKTGGDLL